MILIVVIHRRSRLKMWKFSVHFANELSRNEGWPDDRKVKTHPKNLKTSLQSWNQKSYLKHYILWKTRILWFKPPQLETTRILGSKSHFQFFFFSKKNYFNFFFFLDQLQILIYRKHFFYFQLHKFPTFLFVM